MASILASIGSWLAGAVVPAVKIFVEGVSIVASFLGSLSLGSILMIVFAIALVTVAVIAYYEGFFNDIRNKYENVQLFDVKKIFEKLDAHKGEAAIIEQKLSFCDKDLSKEINNLISEENIEEKKISTMNLFVSDIMSLIAKAGKSGENTCQKNFNLYDNGSALLSYKYKKKEHQIILVFSFYDRKLFEYLIPLIKILRKKGYNLEKKNYETEFKSFHLDEDNVNSYKIIINNI